MSSPRDLALNACSPSSSATKESRSGSTSSSLEPADAPANSAKPAPGSRVLVPQPKLSVQAGSLPIVATASSPQDDGGPSANGVGPMKKSYDIPPRPKPGRKPATDEPLNRRKAQNRESQRAFRARKAEKVHELMRQVDNAQQLHRDEVNALHAELDMWKQQAQELQAQNAQLMSEVDYWKQQHDHLKHGTTAPPPAPSMVFNANYTSFANDEEHKRDQTMATEGTDFISTATGSPSTAVDCGNCNPDNCACMNAVMQDSAYLDESASVPMQGIEHSEPAAYNPEENEIDFTAKFAKPSNDTVMSGEVGCGFCTDASNCICKATALQSSSEAQAQAASAPLIKSTSAPVLQGPGSCERCQADPKMKAWCQRVAQLRADPTPPSSRRSSGSGKGLEPMEPKVENKIDNFSQMSSPIPGTRSIGCTDAYKLLDGRVSMDADHPDWRRLRPLPPLSRHGSSTLSMEPGTYSAMEIDAGSILTTLSHSGASLKPRPSDGPMATLVEKAEELRQAGNSPHVSSPLQVS